jgi:hypothetical protein
MGQGKGIVLKPGETGVSRHAALRCGTLKP